MPEVGTGTVYESGPPSNKPKGPITPQSEGLISPYEQTITTTIRFTQVVTYEVTGPIESQELLLPEGKNVHDLCQQFVEDGEFSDIHEVDRGDPEVEGISFPAQKLAPPTVLTSPTP